jgi:zinc and cadmium transporter
LLAGRERAQPLRIILSCPGDARRRFVCPALFVREQHNRCPSDSPGEPGLSGAAGLIDYIKLQALTIAFDQHHRCYIRSMSTLGWIIGSGLLMSAIALVGSVTLILKAQTLQRILLPLVAFAAGSLIGGAFFHMIPAGIAQYGNRTSFYVWILAGFSAFFALEQLFHWHHCHRASATCKKPLTYLILIGDGLHNFIGGLAIAGTFIVDIRLGIMAWLAAAAHEIPQELGDFGVLVHGGWDKRKALLFNVLSALTFLLGGLLSYAVSFNIDIAFLIPFAAGNFLYIGASDLVPEVKEHKQLGANVVNFIAFIFGLALMLAIKLVLEP